jgi:hypothetical protein
VVGDEWISYRQRADDPQSLVRHFAGVSKAGPIEPKLKRPERTARDFRYPDDLDVFFHSWCASKVHLPEKLQTEIAEILAEGIFAAYEKALERWAKATQRSKLTALLPAVTLTSQVLKAAGSSQ